MSSPDLAFRCPACRGEVQRREQAFVCAACPREFPILFGIPDFRLRSDRYLGLDEERAKARLLDEAAATRTFEQLLAYYYAITDDVTPERARRFADYAARGADRAALALDRFGEFGPGAAMLDVGCGAGGGLIAASRRFDCVVGIDIALRWLVICRKRLKEAGVKATLVCADAASPPFAPSQFSHVLAMDVIEHLEDIDAALDALHGQLRAGGAMWMSANNRRWIGPHPAIGIWAAAYRPAWSRSEREGGQVYDPLRFTAMLSPAMVRRACERAGFGGFCAWPRRIEGGGARAIYAKIADNRTMGPLLTAIGPAFEAVMQTKR